jgi:hypothetical protein
MPHVMNPAHGASALLLALLAALASPAASAERSSIPPTEVRVEVEGYSGTVPLAGRVVLTPRVAGEALAAPLGPEAVASLRVPPRSRWSLRVEVPGHWAAPEEVVAGEGEVTVLHRVPLWPTGTVSGSWKRPEKPAKLPREVDLRLDPPPTASARRAPRGTLTCPVDENGRWRCEVPAGRLDLAIQSPGHVPVYRWGVVLEAGKELPLGALPLREGSSLAGWVVVEDGALPAGRAKARLRPLVAGGNLDPDAGARLRRALLEAPVDGNGFFQLAGVAAGTYLVEVELPGFAPARAFPVEVWEGAETLLKRPLVLTRPLTLELSISPRLDWAGRPWQVEVSRVSDSSASVEPEPAWRGPAGEDGKVEVPGITPGAFHFEVADAEGNRFLSERDVRLETPADARRELVVNLVYLRGEVLRGGEPLAADLWFGGRFGSPRVKMASDEDGAFEGVLPRGGPWRVDLQADEPRIETHVEVEVKPDETGDAQVSIELPDTHLFGRVLDEAGRAVEGARVTLNGLTAALVTKSGPEGEFELRAVPEGRAALDASVSSPEGPKTSDEVFVDLAGDRPVGPVELRLRRTRLVTGRVQSLRGPVPGAVVRVSPARPPMAYTESMHTGLDGAFSIPVPSSAETVSIVVSPPGSTLKAFEVPVADHGAVLNVPDAGGDLHVRLPFPPDDPQAQNLTLVVLQDGRFLPPATLYRWAAGHGVRFQDETGVNVPRLAPGEYTVCLGPLAVLEPRQVPAWIATARCASGPLAAGSRLELAP